MFSSDQKRSIFGGRGSLFGSEGSDEVVVDLNLTPLMDVMSNILFFLLATFGAAILSFLAASVPVQSDADDDEPPEPRKDKVTATVQMTRTSFRIGASGAGVDADKLQALKQEIPKKGDAYDYQALTAALFSMKKEFPASDTMMIVPHDDVVYEMIIKTMQAARSTKLDERKLSLFPKVVVADLVKAEPAEPPELEDEEGDE